MELNQFRIAKEALANLLRHSQAQTVHVQLDYGQAHLRLVVEDDGVGFTEELHNSEVDGDETRQGFGLIGMRERAILLGGQVTISSLVGEGRRKHSIVSMADVAAFAVAAVDNPAARYATIVIGGPEAVSWLDVVDAVGQVIGRELPVRFVQPGEPLPFLLEAVQAPAAALDSYDSPVPMAATAATYGVTLTPLPAVLQRMFGGH